MADILYVYKTSIYANRRTNALADAHFVSATIPIRSAVQTHSGTSMIRVWRILKGC